MFWTTRMYCLPPINPTVYFKVYILGARLKTYLLGRRDPICYKTSGFSTCHTLKSSPSCNSWSTSMMLSSLIQTNVSSTQWSLVNTSMWLVIVSSWRATLDTLSGNYFQLIPLHPQNEPPYASITSYMVGPSRRSLGTYPTKTFQWRSMITNPSNSSRWRRVGTATWWNFLTYCVSVLWMNQFKSGLTISPDLLHHEIPNPLGTSNTPLYVLSSR